MYVADFETTTDENDCRVWAWGLFEIGSFDNFVYGTNIQSFMEKMRELSEHNETVYFHNLKFDGEFIIHWLFINGWSHFTDKSDKSSKTFTTLISDKNIFYSIEIFFTVGKKKVRKIRFLDSYKILPMSVENMAKGFGLEISKLEIDYTAYRGVDHELSDTEIAYLKNDCVIVSRAIEKLQGEGLTKMTTASNALTNYRRSIGYNKYDDWFPRPAYDADVRQAYRGGFTYVNPVYQNRCISEGIVLDVNSLYPSVMYYKPLPYDEPKFFEGQYQHDELYDEYIQMLVCNFKLKEGYIPTIQIKHNPMFGVTEYITDSKGEDVALCLSSVDLELFFRHYEVYNVQYISGWKWKSSIMLFKKYIDYWYERKRIASEEGNSALRTISKLMLNSLYGKFGTLPKTRSKIPLFDHVDNRVKYVFGEWEDRPPIYIPAAVFITSWARYITITSAQSVYNRFVYADTDSLHLVGTELPQNLKIDDTELGAWKLEKHFTRGLFIRAKSYIEEVNGKIEVTCAGLPASCHNQVNFENFRVGMAYTGKLQQKRVQGGIILHEGEFTIK